MKSQVHNTESASAHEDTAVHKHSQKHLHTLQTNSLTSKRGQREQPHLRPTFCGEDARHHDHLEKSGGNVEHQCTQHEIDAT